MLYGGLPPIMYISSPEGKADFLKSLFKKNYISDIVGRHNVRNRAEPKEISNILSSAFGSLTNPTKLPATFKTVKQKTISNTTIKRYIDYFGDSILLDNAVCYDIKGKSILIHLSNITLLIWDCAMPVSISVNWKEFILWRISSSMS